MTDHVKRVVRKSLSKDSITGQRCDQGYGSCTSKQDACSEWMLLPIRMVHYRSAVPFRG